MRLASRLSLLCGLCLLQSQVALSEPAVKLPAPPACHFSGQFDQRKPVKGLPVPVRSSGTFYYSCKDGLIWNTLAPLRQTLVLTDAGIHFELVDVALKRLDSRYLQFVAQLQLDILSGDTGSLQKRFSVEQSANAGRDTTWILTPVQAIVRRAVDSIVLEKPADADRLQIAIATQEAGTSTIATSLDQTYASRQQATRACARLFSDVSLPKSRPGRSVCDLVARPRDFTAPTRQADPAYRDR